MDSGRFQKMGIPGLYIADDCAKSLHVTIIAAAHGAKAALAINAELLREDVRP